MRSVVVKADGGNKGVTVFATTQYNHTQILKKAPDTVVDAIEYIVEESRSQAG